MILHLDSTEMKNGRLEKLVAELKAENAKLRAALEQVEWVSGWDVEGHKVIYCPWCNRIKGFGHTFGCARQSALKGEGK